MADSDQETLVTFDQALTNAAFDASAFTGVANISGGKRDYVGGGPTSIIGPTARFFSTLTVPSAGPLDVDYTAAPPALTGLVGGLPVAPFVDLPLVRVP